MTHYMTIFPILTIYAILFFKGELSISKFKEDFKSNLLLLFPLLSWIIYLISNLEKRGSIPYTYWLKTGLLTNLYNSFRIFDWCENHSIFPFILFLSIIPFYRNEKEESFLFKLFYIPLVLYTLFSIFIWIISGTHLFQTNHISYLLPLFILLNLNLLTKIKSHVIVILFILIIIFRPSLVVINRTLSTPIEPWYIIGTFFNDFNHTNKKLLVIPDSFVDEFRIKFPKIPIEIVTPKNIDKKLDSISKNSTIFLARVIESFSDSTGIPELLEKKITDRFKSYNFSTIRILKNSGRKVKLIIFSKDFPIKLSLNTKWRIEKILSDSILISQNSTPIRSPNFFYAKSHKEYELKPKIVHIQPLSTYVLNILTMVIIISLTCSLLTD
jgi:hypothetical protein